jgi:hypothetical protein
MTGREHAGAGTRRIEVDFEYGHLREACVGVPFVIYPDLSVAGWVQEALRIVPESESRKAWARFGKDSISIGKFDEMERENAELIAILEGHGVKVWRPEVLTRERVVASIGEEFVRLAGVSQQYTRDPVVVVGSEVIECTMGSLYRRADILGLARPLLERVTGSGAHWVAMPAVDDSLLIREGQFDKTSFPVLEGGYVIFDGQGVVKALEARGIEVSPIRFGAHNEDGGSIRCSTLPLLRQLGG